MLVAAGASVGSATAQDSLYDRLGGQDFIECWIDKSLSVIGKDKRIADFFAGELRTEDLRGGLIDFACAATGGDCVYGGLDMVCAHAGLGIGHDDFSTFIEDLERGARRCQRDKAAYAELAKVLRSLRPDVVQDDPGEGDSCV
jgi:truncated hemoglobin YjbI